MTVNGLQLYGVCVCVITVEEVIYSIYPQKIILIIIFFAT